MNRDPAFLFYTQDFLIGTAELSNEEVGKYIRILCFLHQKGRMKEETIRLLVGSISDNLRLKLVIDENGFLTNKRLEFEIEKRKKFNESRRNNGKKGGRPKKPIGKPNQNLHENEIYNIFYNKEILLSNNNNNYIKFVKFLFETNPNKKPLTKVLNLSDQITFDTFTEITKDYSNDKIKQTILNLENYTKRNYKSFNLTLRQWLKK